jgi:3-isopropylmalate/(R)-2-methylmalate dehydratase large subunit
MKKPLSLFEKIWNRHVVMENEAGETLLFVDRTYLDETCFIVFDDLQRYQRKVHRPDLTFVFADHLAPTRDRAAGYRDPEARAAVDMLKQHIGGTGITEFGLGDPRQGIMHVSAPELGLTLPGLIIAADDSHTTTHGAFGALALGVGFSECTHILATQTLWQPRLKSMRINISGRRGLGVSAKDAILAIIGRIGVAGGIGHVIEFAGSHVESMSMEERMTLCNMSVEAGARAGIIAPDETTVSSLRDRSYAPRGAEWDAALASWRELYSDPGATFDTEFSLDAGELMPMVTWGTSPEDVVAINGMVPDPALHANANQRTRQTEALEYMGLQPGLKITDIAVDRVFIGSCTNGRIEDLRVAARIARQGHAVVPTMVVPGSTAVKKQAESEGLDALFKTAGFEWLDAGCSMCVGMNGDLLQPGQRSVSTTNRNFVGRQGIGARTHLASPAVAAASALVGRISDPRSFLRTE